MPAKSNDNCSQLFRNFYLSRSDPSLGTSAFIDRLQNHLMDRFKSAKKITADITKNARTVAKFRKEAVRVFKILSANKEIQSVVSLPSHA